MFAVITDDKRHIKEDVEECALETTAFNYKRRRSATSHLTTNKYKIRTMMKYTPWQISEMGFLKYYSFPRLWYVFFVTKNANFAAFIM